MLSGCVLTDKKADDCKALEARATTRVDVVEAQGPRAGQAHAHETTSRRRLPRAAAATARHVQQEARGALDALMPSVSVLEADAEADTDRSHDTGQRSTQGARPAAKRSRVGASRKAVEGKRSRGGRIPYHAAGSDTKSLCRKRDRRKRRR